MVENKEKEEAKEKRRELLEEGERLRAEKEIEEKGEQIQLIKLSLGKERYGARASQVREIAKAPQIAKVPGTPSYILGVVNLRGEIIPVVDLKELMGLERIKPEEMVWLVIVKRERDEVGLLVDEVLDIIQIPSGQIEPPLLTLRSDKGEYLEGEVKIEDGLLGILNLEKLLLNTSLT